MRLYLMHEHVDLLAVNIIYNIEHNFFMTCAVVQTYIRSILLEILPDSIRLTTYRVNSKF